MLTVHLTTSVAWLGAVIAFLGLALAGWRAVDPPAMQAAYLSMETITWFAIVPLALASPVSGMVQALQTPWGLLKHHWVLIKLLITVVATLILLVHLRPIGHLADAVRDATLVHGPLEGMRLQMVADAAAAIVALSIATVLSIFKPRGLTPFAR